MIIIIANTWGVGINQVVTLCVQVLLLSQGTRGLKHYTPKTFNFGTFEQKFSDRFLDFGQNRYERPGEGVPKWTADPVELPACRK